MAIKLGRNDMCVCGSNVKYKKCCLNNNRVQIHENSPSIPKASERILELASDYLEELTDFESRKKMVILACCAWNVSLQNAEEREKDIAIIKKRLNKDSNFEMDMALDSIFNDLIQRKLTLYANDKRFIKDFEVTKRNGGLYLNVMGVIDDEGFQLMSA